MCEILYLFLIVSKLFLISVVTVFYILFQRPRVSHYILYSDVIIIFAVELYQALIHSFTNYSPGLDSSESQYLAFKVALGLERNEIMRNTMGYYIWYIL